MVNGRSGRVYGPEQGATVTVADFEGWLQNLLTRLIADRKRWVVVAEMTKRPPLRYLQVMVKEHGVLVAECVGNGYLALDEAIAAADEGQLRALGWEAPTGTQRNWWKVDDSSAIGEFVERWAGTARVVFRVDESDQVTVRWWSSSGHRGWPSSADAPTRVTIWVRNAGPQHTDPWSSEGSIS